MSEKTILEQWREAAYDQSADKGKLQKFWAAYFNIEKGIYEINGEKLPDRCSNFSLEFENGEWSLMITASKLYTNSDQTI